MNTTFWNFYKKNSKFDHSWFKYPVQDNLFTVIVPTFNRSHTIIETLDSVKSQTYRPVEIIIQDDGSTDNTNEVVTEWTNRNSEKDLSIRYFIQENRGVCNARNNALKESKGRYVQFLDSDDLLEKRRFELAFAKFKESGADYLETNCFGFVQENGLNKIIQELKSHPNKSQRELLLAGKLWPNTLRPIYKRELIQKAGKWNEEMSTFQDLEYVSRCLFLDSVKAVSLDEEGSGCFARREGIRMSDIFLTPEGRQLRLHCEKVMFNEAIESSEKISMDIFILFKSRIYGLAFRTRASGWKGLAKECYHLAESIKVPLNSKAKQRRLVYKSGKLGSRFYLYLANIKKTNK